MKKKEMKKVTESVEKAVKRFLKHTEFYEYSDDMVVGVYSTPEGILVRMKQGQAGLTTMPTEPLPELGLTGYELLGLNTKSANRVVVKEHDHENGKKLSTIFYDITRPSDKKKEEETKEVPLYANMQKELIEDVTEDNEKAPNGGAVLTESDFDEEVEKYLNTFEKGTTFKLASLPLDDMSGLLASATIDTLIKLIMQDYEDHGIAYDKFIVSNDVKLGLYELLVAVTYRANVLDQSVVQLTKQISDGIQEDVERSETMVKQEAEIEALKRENATLKDQIGDLQRELDGINRGAADTLNTIQDMTSKFAKKEFVRMNSFRAYITTVLSKPDSFITLNNLMIFIQGVLKEENGKFPFVSSLKKAGASRRDYELMRDDKIDGDTFKLKQLKALLSVYADGNAETILNMQNILWKAPFRLYRSATDEITHEALNDLRADIIKGQGAAQDAEKKEESQVLTEA